MKSKTTLILFVIFTILLLAVILVERAGEDRAKEAAAGVPLFPEFSAEKARKIELSGKGADVVLEMKKGDWLVATSDQYPADPDGVSKILEKTGAIEKKDIISNQESKHPMFDVDPEKGIHAKISGEGETVLADLYVGKAGTDYRSTYVRAAGDPEVLLVPETLLSVFYRGNQTWKNRWIFNIPKETITTVEIHKDDATYMLHTEDGKSWIITSPTEEESPAAERPIDSLLVNISKLMAEDWAETQGADALATYQLDSPSAMTVIRTQDGSRHTLYWGGENEKGQIYVKRDDSDTIFLIGQYRRGNILKNMDELMEETSPAGSQPAIPGGQ